MKLPQMVAVASADQTSSATESVVLGDYQGRVSAAIADSLTGHIELQIGRLQMQTGRIQTHTGSLGGAHHLIAVAFARPSLHQDILATQVILSRRPGVFPGDIWQLFQRPPGIRYVESDIATATPASVEDPIFDRRFVDKFRQSLAEIDRLGDLEEGWDAYDASRVGPDARHRSAKFLRILSARTGNVLPPEIFASASGGVVFRWNLPTRTVEAEVADDSCRYFEETHDLKRHHKALDPSDLDGLAGLVSAHLT